MCSLPLLTCLSLLDLIPKNEAPGSAVGIAITMPMSLRTNPTKKLLFEQEAYRPAKRVKTGSFPSAARNYQYEGVFPKFNATEPKAPVSQSTSSSCLSPSKLHVLLEQSHVPQNIRRPNLKDLPASAAHQVTWIARAIQALAPREWGVEERVASVYGDHSSDSSKQFLQNLRSAHKNVIPRQIHREQAVNDYNSFHNVRLQQQQFVGTDSSFPPLPLDPGLADRMFSRRPEDTYSDELRNICGRIIIQGLSKGSCSHDEHMAKELKTIVQSSQDCAPYIAAFEALAGQADIVSAICDAMKAQAHGHANVPFIQVVPNPNEVPSLVADGDSSSLTSPVQTIRSESVESTRIDAVIPRQRISKSTSTRPPRPALLPAVGALPSTNGVHGEFGAIKDRTGDSVSSNSSENSPLPIPGIPFHRLLVDPIVNAANRASATMHEMALGRPFVHTDPSNRLGFGQNLPLASPGPNSFTSPLLKPKYDFKYVTPYTHLPNAQGSEKDSPFRHSNMASDVHARSQSVATKDVAHDGKLEIQKSVSANSPKSVGQDRMHSTVPDDENDIFLTEAQLDDFLALANGGKLADDSETDTDDGLPSLDRNRIIIRSADPGKTNDIPFTNLVEGIIAELVTEHDRGHGLAFLLPHVAHYQSVNRERFAAEIRGYVVAAPPVVNVAISTERSDAMKALYKHFERRVTRSSS